MPYGNTNQVRDASQLWVHKDCAAAKAMGIYGARTLDGEDDYSMLWLHEDGASTGVY